MIPTISDIIESLKSHVENIDSDTVEPDPEELYLRTVVAELEAIMLGFVSIPGGDELALKVAVTRIPGILHLYKLY